MRFQAPSRSCKSHRRLLTIFSAACLSLAATESPAQNPAETYVWQGGSQLWSVPANWGTVDVPNSADVAAEIDGGKTSVNSLVSVNGNFTVGELAIDAGDGIFITEGSSLTIEGSSLFAGEGTLANSGRVTFEGGTYQGALTLSGSVTLVGGGTITLIPTIGINGDNATLTNVDNTIEGYSGGEGVDGITANNLTITNQAAGVINANVNGKYLTVSPRGGTVTNAGLLVATNGGTLDLDGSYGATFTNVGAGTMQALDGSTLLVRGSSIVGGTLGTAGTGTIQLNSGTLTNVTNAGAIVDFNGEVTTLAGTLTNRGTIVCQYTLGDGGLLSLNGDVTLNGGGSITLVDRYGIVGTGTFTNVDNTIMGYGNGALGSNQIAIVNEAAGVIDANVSGQTLDVDPGDGGLINAGLMEATNGGTLQLNGNYGQGFTNTGAGTMQAADGSTVLVNQASVTGGTVSTVGSGLIQIYRGSDDSAFTNVTNTGSLFVDGTVDLTGTFTNRGGVTFGSNGGNGGITIGMVGNVTLNGGGTITMTSGSDITGDGGTLTNVDNTIQGFGSLGSDRIGIVNAAAGIINANASGQTLNVDPAAGGLTNAGLMEASNGGTLFLNIDNGQGFTNEGEYRVNDGSTITATQGGVLNLVNGTLTGGTYTVLSTGSAATTLGFGGNNVTTNAATVVLSGTNSVFAELGALSDNCGSLSLLAQRQFTTAGALSNEGTITLDAGSTLHVSGNFTAAVAAADTSAARRDGVHTQAATASTLSFVVGGTAAQGSLSPGVLQIAGAAKMAGLIEVALSQLAATPNVTDSVVLVSAQSITGTFDNAPDGARIPTTDGRGSYVVNYGATAIGLSRFLAPGQTETTPVVTVAVVGDGEAVEGGENGKVAIRRAGDITSALNVRYKVVGGVVAGVDYKPLTGVATIPAGAAQVKVKIKPINDGVSEGTRIAKIKLKPATDGSYALGSVVAAKVRIIYTD